MRAIQRRAHTSPPTKTNTHERIKLVNLVDTSERSCKSENVANNFVLYRPQPDDERLDERLTTRTPFVNSQDASFLLACANHRHGYRKGSDLIAVVHARLPVTPVGLTEAPYVGDATVRAAAGAAVCGSRHLCCCLPVLGLAPPTHTRSRAVCAARVCLSLSTAGLQCRRTTCATLRSRWWT